MRQQWDLFAHSHMGKGFPQEEETQQDQFQFMALTV
jgi:hypothetical protein